MVIIEIKTKKLKISIQTIIVIIFHKQYYRKKAKREKQLNR
jgi:hypothetical protein